MYRSGFSLVECMIYSCIMMCLSFFANEFFSQNYVHLVSYIKKNNELICVYAAHDALHNDIMHASDQKHNWVQKAHELICKTLEADVAWRLQGTTLYRTSGEYDYVRNQWNKKNSTLIAQHIDTFDCWIESKDNQVIKVQSCIAAQGAEPMSAISWLSGRIIE